MTQLIDISALASCFKEYGPHPLHYLYRLIMPAESSAYNLLGNTVNAMFDAIVTDPDHTGSDQLSHILQRAWHDDALLFLNADDDALHRRYFQVIGQQYEHLQQVIDKDFRQAHIDPAEAWLEPSFICPALGLSGRMDLLSLPAQCQSDAADSPAHIIELKSGKMNEWQHRAKQAHQVQTLLYAHMLHHCLGMAEGQIQSHLLYNAYPLLIPQPRPDALFQQAMELQQQIRSILHELAQGEGRQYFTRQAIEGMYPGCSSKLWITHEKPHLLQFVASIEDAPAQLRQWFFDRLQFILREEELRAQQPEAVSLRQLEASALVLTDPATVSGIRLQLRGDEEHDFRTGDPVIVYQQADAGTQAWQSIVLRGSVAEVEGGCLTVTFRHPERPCHFCLTAPYAIEHDNINSSISQACRSIYRTLLNGGPSLPHCRLIVGPPGTGKTSVTLRQLVSQLQHHTQHRVLIMAFTHRAVDEICETLMAALPPAGFLRLGTPTDTPAAYRPYLLQHLIDQCPDRDSLRQAIAQTRFWVGTTARLQATYQLFDLLPFDTIIVDEASQLLDFQVIDLLQQARTETILIGDPKQLPAVTLQPGAQSLFEQLYRSGTPTVLLDHQGRMHPDIAQLANQMFYGNKLHAVGLPHQLESDSVMPRYWFFDVRTPALGTKANPAEARMVTRLVRRIAEVYERERWDWTDKTLGIIVPYRQQIAAIRQELEGLPVTASCINIDTVERYQGSQRDVIIFTTTVSTLEQLAQLSSPVELDGQLIDRKLNVAITRARKHLFIVGNRALLCQNTVYQDLLCRMTDKMSSAN